MKQIKFNKTNLTDEEIDRRVNKVRAFIVNEKGQLLVCRYAGIYLLPGGSIDEGESKEEALKREISEEAAINIDTENAVPFLQIQSYDRNYYDRKLKRDINRLTDTTFYTVKTNQDIDISNQRLTESEKEKDFEIFFTSMPRLKHLLETNQTTNNKKANFDRELLTALDAYTDFLRGKQNVMDEY